MENTILVQYSQSVYMDKAIDLVDGEFDTIVVTDDSIVSTLLSEHHAISAMLVFDLTEKTHQLCKLARNERYCNPTLPIAYVGHDNCGAVIPFGVSRFCDDNMSSLKGYLKGRSLITALVVEDDEHISESMCLTLSRFMDVHSARDGETACEMISKKSYDLVVLDLMLTLMSGEEVFAYARRCSPTTAIVILTAYDTPEKEFRLTYNGAAGYLKKPIENNKQFRKTLTDMVIDNHLANAHKELVTSLKQQEDERRDYRNLMSGYM